MSFFSPFFTFLFAVVLLNCPLDCTILPSSTLVLFFYHVLYIFGFLLILLACCCHLPYSQQGLAARCSLYHWHLDTRAVGLLDRHTHAR